MEVDVPPPSVQIDPLRPPVSPPLLRGYDVFVAHNPPYNPLKKF